MKLETRSLSELKDFPKNPRIIRNDEYDALKHALKEFGMVQPLVVNKKNEVIGGNQRLHAMRDIGINETEVVVVKLPPKKEMALNLALNKIHGEWNMPALQQVMQELEKSDLDLAGFSDAEVKAMLSSIDVSDTTLHQLTKDLKTSVEDVEAGIAPPTLSAQDYGGGFIPDGQIYVPTGPEAGGQGIPDALFPTDNEYGIPLLREDMQATLVQAPVMVYEATHHVKMAGTWLFYCYDLQFDKIWKSPDKLLDSGAYACGEVNASCYDQTPLAVVLYNTYRKRWISRYWQERGIRILVDINTGEKWREANMIGVPKGWSAFCTRGYKEEIANGKLQRDYDFCKTWAGKDPLFLVYGGGKQAVALCKERGWLYVENAELLMNNAKAFNQID